MPKYLLFILIGLIVFYQVLCLDQNIIKLEYGNFFSIDKDISQNNCQKWSKNLTSILTNSESVYVYIDSNGGSVEAGNKLINLFDYYIKNGKKIDCIAKNAFSMAFQIFQSCSTRYIVPSSILMQHQISLSSIKGQLTNTLNYLKMIQTISDDLNKRSAKRIDMPFDDYVKLIQTDWWTYGDDILKYRLADSVINIGCDFNLYNMYYDEIETDFIIDSDGLITIKENTIKKPLCPL
jgi:ATP-dependent protease ClpP protease subunit